MYLSPNRNFLGNIGNIDEAIFSKHVICVIVLVLVQHIQCLMFTLNGFENKSV